MDKKKVDDAFKKMIKSADKSETKLKDDMKKNARKVCNGWGLGHLAGRAPCNGWCLWDQLFWGVGAGPR